MKSIQDLAREAGAAQQGRHWIFDRSDLERFHTLAIEQEHKRLLEGSGEPIVLTESNDGTPTAYTADQMAAAVLKERERCADICDVHATGWEQDPGINPQAGFIASSNCAAAIRGQR